jgi:hypothetical protein
MALNIMPRCVVEVFWRFEESAAFTFRIRKQTKQETSMYKCCILIEVAKFFTVLAV